MNRRTKMGIISAVVLIFIVGAIYFFGGWPHYQNGPVQELSVRFGWVHQGQFAGMYVAKEKGFYEDVGLSVNFLELDKDSDQVKELDIGDVDVSIMEAHQLIEGVSGGADIKAVMVIYQINPHVLAVREDSNIYGPEDFTGKVVGLAGGKGEGNAIFRVFIEDFNEVGSIIYKDLGFNTVDNFINKEADIIDLYRIDQPYLANKRGISLRLIPLDAYGFSTYGDVIAVHSNMIEKQPDVVQKFVKATQKGWEYALEHPEEAVAITLPYTQGDYKDKDYQMHILRQSIPLIRGGQSDLGRMDFVVWSTLYESMRSVGAFDREFDVRNIYTNEFIK